jgi:hypothetical protein
MAFIKKFKDAFKGLPHSLSMNSIKIIAICSIISILLAIIFRFGYFDWIIVIILI